MRGNDSDGDKYKVKNKGLLGLGGALIGAGVGYGIGQSISEGKNFFNEMRGFYGNLFGLERAGDQVEGAKASILCPMPWAGGLSNAAIVPDLWSWMGDIKLNLKLNLKLNFISTDYINKDIPIETLVNSFLIGAMTLNPSVLEFNNYNRSINLDNTYEKYKLQIGNRYDNVFTNSDLYSFSINNNTILVPGNYQLNITLRDPSGIFSREMRQRTDGIKINGAGFREADRVRTDSRLSIIRSINNTIVSVFGLTKRVQTYKRVKIFGITILRWKYNG